MLCPFDGVASNVCEFISRLPHSSTDDRLFDSCPVHVEEDRSVIFAKPNTPVSSRLWDQANVLSLAHRHGLTQACALVITAHWATATWQVLVFDYNSLEGGVGLESSIVVHEYWGEGRRSRRSDDQTGRFNPRLLQVKFCVTNVAWLL